MTLQNLAWQLNGTVNWPWINVSGPGHGAGDRSLGILFDPKAPDGFRVHSLASATKQLELTLSFDTHRGKEQIGTIS